LTVVRAGQDKPIPGAKARTVLAALLVRAPQPVSAATLIEEVWGGRPPESALNTLQKHISVLRQLLQPDRGAGQEPSLSHGPGGYYLAIEPEQVDSWLFEEALRDGAEALERFEPGKAAERLREGLSLWRGPAYADDDGLIVDEEARRLDEERVRALDLRIQADLALGRHAELIGELEGLVRQHPSREQFIAYLMLALYRSKRQRDALAVYGDAWKRLKEEGLSPSRDLRELQEQILNHDSRLELTEPAARAGTGAGRTRPAGPSGLPAAVAKVPRGISVRRWPLVAAGVVAILAGIVTLFVRLPGSHPEVFNEFDLGVRDSIGYDLDIRPGQPPDLHATNNARSPDYAYIDFYRTSGKTIRGRSRAFRSPATRTTTTPSTSCAQSTRPRPAGSSQLGPKATSSCATCTKAPRYASIRTNSAGH